MSFILLGILNSQAAGAGGAGGGYDLLETQTLSASASSITFTGLDSYSNYKHLQLRMLLRSDQVAYASRIGIRINSDSGSNYGSHTLYGTGSGVYTSSSLNQTSIQRFQTTASQTAADIYSANIVDFLDFASSNKNTTVRGIQGYAQTENNISIVSGLWQNTSAVTSIQIIDAFNNDLVAGSKVSLYGIGG